MFIVFTTVSPALGTVSGIYLHLVNSVVTKVKGQPSEWEKIIANETTDKGLISKIYKQLIQLNTITQNKQPNEKVVKKT